MKISSKGYHELCLAIYVQAENLASDYTHEEAESEADVVFISNEGPYQFTVRVDIEVDDIEYEEDTDTLQYSVTITCTHIEVGLTEGEDDDLDDLTDALIQEFVGEIIYTDSNIL